MPRFRSTASPLLGLLAALCPAAAAPAGAEERACSALTALARPDLRILRAEPVPEGTLPAENPGRAALTGAARANAAMPAHCVVEGAINPRTGAGGQSFAIGFELRLPANWNGRLLFQGGGGMDGVLNEAVGAIPVSGATAPPALNRGYAVVSTDSGHRGRDPSDASFALDQQARLDYGYAAIGEVSREARAVLSARYGRGPDRAYYMGCSNGGRTAMMAAQRFPTAFDGIVAGNPGFRLSRAAIAQAWDVAAFTRAAPRDAEGKPILAAALSEGDLRLLADAVLRRCDAADGLADGSIDAMAACRFDPASLRCPGAAKEESCLSAPQVEALEQVFTGARDGGGRALYTGWPWDAGIAAPGWRAWKLGTSRTAAPNARNATLTPASLGLYFMTPPVSSLDLQSVDFDRIAQQTAQTAAINDATATMLSSFASPRRPPARLPWQQRPRVLGRRPPRLLAGTRPRQWRPRRPGRLGKALHGPRHGALRRRPRPRRLRPARRHRSLGGGGQGARPPRCEGCRLPRPQPAALSLPIGSTLQRQRRRAERGQLRLPRASGAVSDAYAASFSIRFSRCRSSASTASSSGRSAPESLSAFASAAISRISPSFR